MKPTRCRNTRIFGYGNVEKCDDGKFGTGSRVRREHKVTSNAGDY